MFSARCVHRRRVRVVAAVGAMLLPVVMLQSATAAPNGVTAAPTAPRAADDSATLDDLLARVAREVPGFGGAYVMGDAAAGETERLVVWLTAGAQGRGREAQQALARVLGARFAQSSVEVRRADYGFADLKSWHDELLGAFTLPGVVFTDVDESRNRLLVGIENPETNAAAVRAFAAERGIPAEALTVTPATPFRQLLRSDRRPMRGGLQIQFQAGAFGLATGTCTLGYPAVRGGVNGFVTNSHCSRTQAEVDNGRYWQATRPFFDNDQVGTETVDPGFFSGTTNCPWSGLRCRHSDANFVRAHDASHIVRGTITRIGTSSLTWNGTSLWRVVAAPATSLNMVVTKVGRTTGLTSGIVSHTCANVQQEGTNNVILCEAMSDMWVDAGDSGSPAFRVTNSPTTHDVEALGIVWGGGTVNGVDTSVFSPIADVKSEIGSLLVCAGGFNC